jgi:peptide/nickel transport system permease protein
LNITVDQFTPFALANLIYSESKISNMEDLVSLISVALGWGAAAALMRLTRSSMLEILDSEYIRLARAKGVNWSTVIFKHALRNALSAPVTSALLIFSGWLNGALVVEIIFSWPGIGYDALYKAVNDNDFPLLLGTVFVFILIYLIFATLADIAYTIIDPRVRLN